VPNLDLIATDHRLQINSHSSIVQTITVNEASGVIEPPTVIEGTSVNLGFIDATMVHAGSDSYGLKTSSYPSLCLLQ